VIKLISAVFVIKYTRFVELELGRIGLNRNGNRAHCNCRLESAVVILSHICEAVDFRNGVRQRGNAIISYCDIWI